LYELLWFRLLGHVFGSTATATATLLAAYLFGLGLGAWIFGRLSDRMARVWLVYVGVELAIGVYGVASRVLLERGAVLYETAHGLAAGDPKLLLFARFLVSFVLVAVPTTLMGGTFPLMVQLLRRRDGGVGRAAGRAYAINTAGAAIGALALPFLVLPRLGVGYSLAVAASANGLAALLVWHHAGRARRMDASAPSARAQTPGSERKGALVPLVVGFFFSSFSSLALETVWTRHLSLFFGPHVYTFAFVLFAYLVGLFVGGALFARLLARGVPAITLLRGGLLVAGAGMALTTPFLDALAIPQIAAMLALGVSHGSFLLTSGLTTFVLVLPAAAGFGAVFPAVIAVLGRGRLEAGASVALAYAVNTLGTTLGAVGAGFLLVPSIGSQRTLEICVLLVAAAFALAPSESAARRRGAVRRTAVVALAFFPVFAPRWDWRLAHAGYSKDPRAFAQKYAEGRLTPTLEDGEVVFLREGAEATVAVLGSRGGTRSLLVNGKPDASDVPSDMVTQRLLGLIPGLFQPAQKRAFVLGLGSGATAAALLRYPVESVEVAEISPDVAEAARMHFEKINEGCLRDPRLSLRLDDGRNYLHFQPPDTYDVIVSEPSNPWMASVSGLFTDEFFEEVRTRLRPGGVFCQWLHFYSMTFEHARLVVRTFTRRFPDSAVFVVIGSYLSGDALLIGSKGPLRLAHLPEDPALAPAVREALARERITGAQQLLFGLVAAPGQLGEIGGPGPVNTDDLPLLEFAAPRDRFLETSRENLSRLLKASPDLELALGPADNTLARYGFELQAGHSPPAAASPVARVLSRVNPRGGGLTRWSLLGLEFPDPRGKTALYRLLGPSRGEEEVLAVTRSLAGASPQSDSGQVPVSGHMANWIAAPAGGGRVVAVGWECASRNEALFLTRRITANDSLANGAVALDLTRRFACSH
jgi:spermidine synthase